MIVRSSRPRLAVVSSLVSLALLSVVVSPSRADLFTNTTPILINDNTTANPYPSTINVSGMGNTLTNLSVSLYNLTHTFPGDIAAILVGPNGGKTGLMLGAGGAGAVSNVNLTFSDTAVNVLPQFGQITSGTYQTANYLGSSFSLSSPAPSGPYTDSVLTPFDRSNPNGNWSLYVQDTATGDFGQVAGGWGIDVTAINTVTQTFGGGSITINDNSPGSPYPSTINVSGVTGALTDIRVTLSQFSHTFPGDVDVLLVGPNGAKVKLLGQVGGGTDVVNANLTFSDLATATVPSPIVSGTYRPTNGTTSNMPTPAPTGPYGTSLLGAFGSSNVNGAWSLFVRDAAGQDVGSIGSWSLSFVSGGGSVITTPEPTPFVFLALGALGVTTLRRRRKG